MSLFCVVVVAGVKNWKQNLIWPSNSYVVYVGRRSFERNQCKKTTCAIDTKYPISRCDKRLKASARERPVKTHRPSKK